MNEFNFNKIFYACRKGASENKACAARRKSK